MIWEDDGYYHTIVVIAAKNYVLYDSEKGKLEFRGNSLIDQKKEPALKEMLETLCKDMIYDGGFNLLDIYSRYIREAKNPKDIKRWAQKKTLSKSILECKKSQDVRPNEMNIWQAVKDKQLQEGDKFYVYPAIFEREVLTKTLKNGKIKEREILVTGLKCVEDWDNDHDSNKLVSRVVDTMNILANVVDMEKFIDYSLVKNKELLRDL